MHCELLSAGRAQGLLTSGGLGGGVGFQSGTPSGPKGGVLDKTGREGKEPEA